MRPDVLIPPFIGFFFGLLLFIVMARNIKAHLKRLRDFLEFFLWPFPPFRMLIVQKLDGDVKIYYDNEFSEEHGEKRYLVKTIYGDQYVTRIPPSQASLVISMFDAKGPTGYHSPFSLAWRWIVAASIFIYSIYYSLVVAWLSPATIREIVVGDTVVRTVVHGSIDPWEVMFATTLFFTALTWYLTVIVRMNDNTIKYAWYHVVGINPPYEIIVPVPGLSTITLIQYIKLLGKNIKIYVSKEVKKIFRSMSKKLGSGSLAATLLARLAMAENWRQALSDVLEEKMDLVIAGDTAMKIRYGGVISTLKRQWLIIVIIAIISFIIGYAFGNAYSIGVAPINATTTTSTAPHVPSATTTPAIPRVTTTTQPFIPQNTTTITPAQPPPPPGG